MSRWPRTVTYKFETEREPEKVNELLPADKYQGHPTDRLGKLSVRKVLNPLQFSKGNFHLELS